MSSNGQLLIYNLTVMLQPYQAAVVGAGPGGLAATVSLLDKGITKIAWIDPKFTGGRLNELYREISSYAPPREHLCGLAVD